VKLSLTLHLYICMRYNATVGRLLKTRRNPPPPLSGWFLGFATCLILQNIKDLILVCKAQFSNILKRIKWPIHKCISSLLILSWKLLVLFKGFLIQDQWFIWFWFQRNQKHFQPDPHSCWRFDVSRWVEKITCTLEISVVKSPSVSPTISSAFAPYQVYEWYPQSKEILLNLGMKCWNTASNAQGSRVILVVLQVGALKIYVAAVEALRKKERQDETEFINKIGGKSSLGPSYFLL
jgi:hypothetical protein